MSPGPDVFFITQLESRKSILGKPHSGNIFPRVLERFNWSSEKENNSGVCVCVCVCVCVRVCVCKVIQEEVVSACLLNGTKYFNLQWECQLLNCVQLFKSLWTAAHQAPLSMGFSRPDYWSGLPFDSRGSSQSRGWTWSPALQADFIPSEPPGMPHTEKGFFFLLGIEEYDGS